MHTLLFSLFFGFLGGLARASVGLLKAYRTKKKIKSSYFVFTLVCSGLIGAAAGIIFGSTPQVSVFVGYIGMDLLENGYKIAKRKQII